MREQAFEALPMIGNDTLPLVPERTNQQAVLLGGTRGWLDDPDDPGKGDPKISKNQL